LTGPITDYDWVEGIVLMTVFVLFLVELMVMRYGNFGHDHEHEGDGDDKALQVMDRSGSHKHTLGEDHLGHSKNHSDIEAAQDLGSLEEYTAQMAGIFILEFGVIFHSIFIGLTLAVSGEEFKTLYVVLVFHQTFEGLGLGSRLAVTPWPKSKSWTPYILALAYGVSTPIAIAVGLGVRKTYPPNSQTTLIVNGVFDSISAGILIYTGLVELMAHEFMFSNVMRKASLKVLLSAFIMMCLGAGKFPHHSFRILLTCSRTHGFTGKMGIDWSDINSCFLYKRYPSTCRYDE
jgi:zinc transporter 1/2/3